MRIVFLFLLLLTIGVSAQLSFKPIGSPVASGGSVLSAWIVQGDGLARSVALKVQQAGKEGESNVVLSPEQMDKLQDLCARALAHHDKLASGEILVLGTIESLKSKVDVALAMHQGVKVRLVVVHEEGKEHDFLLDGRSNREMVALLKKARAALASR